MIDFSIFALSSWQYYIYMYPYYIKVVKSKNMMFFFLKFLNSLIPIFLVMKRTTLNIDVYMVPAIMSGPLPREV